MIPEFIEQAGFSAANKAAKGVSASNLGQPDVGLMTRWDMASRVSNITSAVKIPVICDGDTGFGNVVNVARTMVEYEKAGAAAIQLEDQLAPKKCGHMLGRQVIPTEEMVSKIKVAVKARTDPDFLIIARTDARTVFGIEEAIERGKAYEAGGADALFVESPESVEEMRLICSSFRVPTVANMVEQGRTPFLSAEELKEVGYSVVIFPRSNVFTAAKAMKRTMEVLKRSGSTKDCIPDMLLFPEFNETMGLPRIRAIENGDYTAVRLRQRAEPARSRQEKGEVAWWNGLERSSTSYATQRSRMCPR